ncbi:MAG: PAS domain-containing protein [Rhizobiaceae bacterium]|nr:PAS domain-containing protein [Rhizobiaceae bacterium]
MEIEAAAGRPPLGLDASALWDLLEAAADWVWETDSQLRFSWVSDSYQTVTGVDASKVLGRFRFDFLKKVSKASRSGEAHLADLQARRPFRDFVYELTDGNASCRWVSTSGYPRFDAAGTFLGYRGIGRNVTNVAQATEEVEDLQKSLARSEQRVRLFGDGGTDVRERLLAALNAMSDAFCYYDKDDNLVLYNEAFLSIYSGLADIVRPGLSLESLIDAGLERGLWDTSGVPHREWREAFFKRRAELDDWQGTLRFADGRWTMRREMRVEDGGTVAIITDISELKAREARAEKAKTEAVAANERSENLLRDLQRTLDAMRMGVVLVDADMTAQIINKAFYEIWKLRPDEVSVGDHFRSLMDVNRHNGIYDIADMDWEGYVTSRIGEITAGDVAPREFHRADGSTLVYSVTALTGGKRLICYLDVTDAKRREEELARANERSQTMLSDLRRMLDAMKMGVILVDGQLKTELISEQFYEMWGLTPEELPEGSLFGTGMRHNRSRGLYDNLSDAEFETFVADRQAEVRAGDVAPREFHRADGRTLIYSATALSGGKRLVTYYDVSELKQREAELAGALEKARLSEAVLNGVSQPLFVKDSDLNFVLVNAAFASLFELKPEDMMGRKGSDFVPEDDARAFELTERQVLESGVPFEVEEDFEFSGIGRSRVVRKNRIRTDSGKDYVACSIFDITELRRREAEAEEAHRYLAGVVDSMPAGVIIYDRDDRFVLANQRLQQSLPELAPMWVRGKTFREAIEYGHSIAYFRNSGDPHIDALYDTDRDAWADAYMERHRARQILYERQHKDGSWHQVYDMRTDDGTFVGVRVEITELKERERALRESMRQIDVYRHVLDELPVGVFVKTEDLLIEYVNAAWTQMTGVERDRAIGRSDAELFPSSEAQTFSSHDRQVLTSGQGISLEETVTGPGGAVTELMTRKQRLIREDGSIRLYGSCTDITEIKRRERALRDSMRESELLRQVLDELPVMTFMKGMDRRFEYVSKGFTTLTGLSAADVVGKTDRDLFGDNADGFDDADMGIIETGDPVEIEETVPHRDGSSREVMTRKTLLSAIDGTKHLFGCCTDISELKGRENALRDSMRQLDLYKRVLDELPVSTFIKNADLKMEYVNQAWTALTGISRAEAVGKDDLELFGADTGGAYASFDAETRTTRRAVETEEQVIHRDGTVRELMTRKDSLVALDGRLHVFGSSTDITEIKRREDKLKETLRDNEVFRSIIDNVPISIYAKRPDLKLLYVNKGWCELVGVSRDDAIGKSDTDLFGDSAKQYLEGDLAVLRTGQTQEIEEHVVKPDGTMQYQFAKKGVVTASDGSLYLIGSTMDISELKQREQELMEAQRRAVLADRAKSEFLANMSHEIRTPMNGVLGMAELLAKSELNPKQKTFTDIIVKSGNALLTIINDILDFSKIDAGQLVLDPAPFNLAEAIEDVATLVSTRAKEKDLELIVRVEPDCQQLFVGDVGRVRQIITNLLGNAVKFTDSGHVLVDVSSQWTDGQSTRLKLSVTDTGIGIPADKLKLVFEKFSQVDGSSTRRHEGTGLGLAITSRLVELMGGQIGVESDEGRGSTFWFTVTLPNAGRPQAKRVAPVDVTGSRILVVDDNAVNRAILSEQMASWTFDSCAAESGPEGIDVLKAAAQYGLGVDCVVLDFQMPGMTGVDTARVIRATAGIEKTPIIILTSVDQSLSTVAFRDLGIDAQLIKPARSSALLETIVSTIQKHRAVDDVPAAGEVPPTETPAPAREAAVSPAPRRGAVRDDHRLDILVAEDNEVNQLVFTQILSETGYSFEIVNNGRRAVEAYFEMSPRMILMDVSMPEMNGLEATATIRKQESGSETHVPIIGVTAHALKGDRERCLEAGMDDYLPKPISPKALLDKVEKWVRVEGDGERQIG